MSIYCLLIQFSLVNLIHMVAYPKGFTDDPYVDDEKFIEKGKMLFYTILNYYQNLMYIYFSFCAERQMVNLTP